LLSIIQLWGKSPETQAISFDYLMESKPALSTTVTGSRIDKNDLPESLWFHLVHSVVFLRRGGAFD